MRRGKTEAQTGMRLMDCATSLAELEGRTNSLASSNKHHT